MVAPGTMTGAAGTRAMESAGGVTSMTDDASAPSTATTTAARPSVTALTRPTAVTRTVVGSVLHQSSRFQVVVSPALSRSSAVSWRVWPASRNPRAGVTVTDRTG